MVGGEFTGYYRFLKGFYGLADMPPIFQQNIDKTLKHETPAWLDDIIIVTRGTANKHQSEIEKTMTRLEENGYKTSETKTSLFQKEIEWLGHIINENGIKPTNDKIEAFTKIISGSHTTFGKIHKQLI